MQGENLDTSLTTDYSTLQLSSNNTTLERSQKSPHHEVNTLTKPERTRKVQPSSKNLSPEQLKSQLEHNLAQKISHPTAEIYAAEKKPHSDPRTDAEKQTSETDQSKSRFQKFGVRVLPMENKIDGVQPSSRSPKSAELSQNDNNINLERHNEKNIHTIDEGIDEVDKTKLQNEKPEAPPVKRREKNRNGDMPKETITENVKVTEAFQRENSLNGSGIKRDKAGIPQEIPDHMLQAAVAARKNRKSTEIVDKPVVETEETDLVKTPKKTKGKAPAPPPDTGKGDSKMDTEKLASDMFINKTTNTRLNFTDNFDEISTLEEKPKSAKPSDNITNKFDDGTPEIKLENGLSDKPADEMKEYCSDSDVETDNQSSVNTIELNSSDITIHHSEEDSAIKGRKTASTGDLSKIQKGKKSNTGTLERAQSLDITDSGIPTLTKKRKATKDDLEPKLSSDESLYEKTPIKTKEPRLSLALDGLDTFQRNRLKKSSEWGNLEDVIMNLDKVEIDTPTSEEKLDFVEVKSPIKFDFGAKDVNFGNNISNLDDIHVTLVDNKDRMDTDKVDGRSYGVISQMEGHVRNVLWPNMEKNTIEIVKQETEHIHISKPQIVDKKDKVITEKMQEVSNIKVHNVIWPLADVKSHESETKPQLETHISSVQTKPATPEKPTIIQTTTETIIHSSPEPKPLTINHPSSLPEPIANTIQTTAELITTSAILNPKTDTTDSPRMDTRPEIVSEKPSPPQKPVTTAEPSFSLKQQFQEKLNSKLNHKSEISTLTPQPPTSKISSTTTKVGSTFTVKPQTETSVYHPGKSSQNFIFAEKYASNNDNDNYAFSSKLYDTNVSDDIKVSRHSLGSLERPKSDVLKSVNKLKMQNMVSSDQGGVSNVVITESKPNGVQILSNSFDLNKHTENQTDTSINYDMSTASELYTTAIDSTLREDKAENDSVHIVDSSTSPSGIKNITISETVMDSKYITDSPSSLTIDTSSDGPDSIKSNTLTFVTEIQVSTPSSTTNGSQTNVSEIEITTQSPTSVDDKKPEETLKKLAEMKFTTSSYEPPKTPEKRMSQIELLRSNFEKSPPKPSKQVLDISPSKSRIPVATKLDLKFSPERKEFKIGELDAEEKEIVDIMSSSVHSTPLVTSQRFTNKTPVRNVTVTSIRTSSKIPSGSVKPPVPARPSEHAEIHETRTVSSNGGTESSFKQWVFNPSETSVTNIVVNNNKEPHK